MLILCFTDMAKCELMRMECEYFKVSLAAYLTECYVK